MQIPGSESLEPRGVGFLRMMGQSASKHVGQSNQFELLNDGRESMGGVAYRGWFVVAEDVWLGVQGSIPA